MVSEAVGRQLTLIFIEKSFSAMRRISELIGTLTNKIVQFGVILFQGYLMLPKNCLFVTFLSTIGTIG